MLYELVILLTAGFLGGLLNAVAGGGSFITFPALLAVGVSPVSANATNTFAACAGYLSGAYALRKELSAYTGPIIPLLLLGLLGGILGAWLLLLTPEQTFRAAIPWLLLFATIVFIYGNRFNRFLKSIANKHRHADRMGKILLGLFLLAVAIYGGFFNAGLGIVLLSYFTLAGLERINLMNALKLLLSTAISLIAIIIFMLNDSIAWYEGIIVLIGSLIGGYVAAHYSQRMSDQIIRKIVIVVSCSMTVYFFNETYFWTIN